MIEKVAETFGINEAFINGDGTFQPKGILTYNDDEIEQITNNQLDSDIITSLYYSLNEYYAKNASFLMNISTLKNVRLLKSNSTIQYLWQPSLSLNVPDTLIGVPVYQSSHMPTLPNDEQIKDVTYLPIIAVADFKKSLQNSR